MQYFRRRLLFKLFKLSDLCIMICALIIASLSTASDVTFITLNEFLFLKIRIIDILGFSSLLIIWHIALNNFHLYRSRRLRYNRDEWKDILKATVLGTFIVMPVLYMLNLIAITPLFVATFWLLSAFLTISFRGSLRYFLGKIRSYGRNLRFILIAGTNERGYAFAKIIESKEELGCRIAGFIDNEIHISSKKANFLGKLEDFPSILNNYVIDEVVISLPIKSNYEEIQKILLKAEEHGIAVSHISQLFDTKSAQSKAETFNSFSLITLSSKPKDGWMYLVKRVMDIFIAFIVILILSPVMLLAAIAIKITSRGPVLFVQKRVGYNKRIFNLYKFCTMIEGAEKIQSELDNLNEMDGPVFKIINDPRITKIGRLLRKSSIDELPQLVNVLKGDLSLVGPRPLPVRDYNGFNKDWQRRRFSVKPGITCTWQINGRNETSFEDWMKMDMEYIDNWKLSKDLKILLMTIPAVLRGKGAA